MTAMLKISDGTTMIDLRRAGGNPIWLNHWRPVIAQLKGGGTWQQSALSDGRQMVDYRWDNVIETFDLKVSDADPDLLARRVQDLRRLLIKATNYGATDWQGDQVYLITRAERETNIRYAILHSWSTPDDENPFGPTFLQADGKVVMDGWTLSVERGHWTGNVPGTGTCVETSAEQAFYGGLSSATFKPTAQADDAFVRTPSSAINLAVSFLAIGRVVVGGFFHTGIRFRNVTIPQGAIITSAIIRFEGFSTRNAQTVFANIYGEDSDTAAAYTTYANFMARALTSSTVKWSLPDDVTAGNFYDTPDFTAVVQEVVDRALWASGNDMGIQFRTHGDTSFSKYHEFSSWDHPIDAEPELIIAYLDPSTPTTSGRSATCENEVYFANKANEAQLVRLEIDDGAVFQGDLLPGGAPYALLPAVPVANDAVYFGSSPTNPFCSLVFDLSTAQVDCDIIWEYWNGAWVLLATRDNTRLAGGGPFTTTDVCSVHWEQPSDWAANDPGNGVNGLWVRARVDAVGGAPTPPTQQTRNVYTILWPRVDIDSAQVGGDIAALARSLITDQSSAGHPNTSLKAYRIIAGLRTLSRGTDFVAYLNAANEQNPAGLVITAGTDTGFNADILTPTGTRVTYSPVSLNVWVNTLTFTFNASLSSHFYGIFHVFLRARQVGGSAGQIGFRLKTFIGNTEVLQSDPTYFDNLNPWQIIDFGQVQFPGVTIRTTDVAAGSGYIVQGRSSSATPDAYLYDLILIPIDEWAVDSAATSEDSDDGIGSGIFLDTDSIGAKGLIDAMTFDTVSTYLQSVWLPLANGPAIFQENVDQRLWFFTMELASTGSSELQAPPYHGFSIQAFRNQRYLSMRGDR